MENNYIAFCYGFYVEMELLNSKDKDLLMNGIDDFELRSAKGYNGMSGGGYFGYWAQLEKESDSAVCFEPLDFISIQTDVELNRKLVNYARDLCKVSTDHVPSWRVIPFN